jgi:hypothetical protein
MNTFSITSQLTQKEYLKLTYKLLFSKAWIVCLAGFAVLFVLASTIMYFSGNNAFFNSDWYWYGLMFTIWGLLIPIMPLVTVLLSFRSNQLIQEKINFEFTETGVNVTGESFTSTYKWEKFYKVKGLSGWLLLYQSKRTANIIKLTTDDFENVRALKEFLKNSAFKVKVEI